MNGREPFPTNKTGCAHLIRNWCRYPDPHNLQIAWPAHFNLFPSLQHESSTTDARTATSYGFGCDPVARQIELWHQGECPLSSHTQLQAVTPAVVNWCSWFWIPVALVDGFKGFAQIGITVYIYIHTLCIYIHTHYVYIYIYIMANPKCKTNDICTDCTQGESLRIRMQRLNWQKAKLVVQWLYTVMTVNIKRSYGNTIIKTV